MLSYRRLLACLFIYIYNISNYILEAITYLEQEKKMRMNREQWEAIDKHDKSYDGKLFYGLKKGKVVCRPSCRRGNHINPEEIVIFTSLAEAAKFGYRPCKRCKPEDMQWSGAKAEVVLKAKRLIDHAFAEKFDLCAISDQLFVNRSYLCRVFKKETGMTLLEYCNKKRCEYAKSLLTQSELCVAYIAVQSGFSNSSQFCHLFKKMAGKTPCQYRRDYFKAFQES